MAGFGAGFGKALGGSLEAAGKLHQEEQLRSREYERAKADRQAEILDTRTYNERIAAEDRARTAENETHRYSKGPDGKFYYTTLEGTLVEKDPNSPGVRLYLQDEEKRGQDKTLFGLKVRQAESGIAVDRAQIGNLNASAAAARAKSKAEAGKLPDDVYAKVQFDLKPVTTRYDNIDKKTQGIIARLENNNSKPGVTADQRKANNALIAEARGMRSALLGSQQALSAQYVASGFQADPMELFKPRASELATKYPNAWGRFVEENKRDWENTDAAAEAARKRNLTQSND